METNQFKTHLYQTKGFRIALIGLILLTGCNTMWVKSSSSPEELKRVNTYCQSLAEQSCAGLMLNLLQESICEARMTTSCMNGKGWK
jgi:hypothetical protein